MKKYAAFLAAIWILALCAGCAEELEAAEVAPPVSGVSEMRPSPRREYITFTGSMSEDSYIPTLQDLEKASCAIVSGKVTGKREVLFVQGEGNPPTGITVSTLHVENVLKNDGAVAENTDLDFLEYYWTEMDTDGETELIYTYDYYVPTNMGEEYLLFLSPLTDSDYENPARYTPTVLWMGKYPIRKDIAAARSAAKLPAQAAEINDEAGRPENYFDILGELLSSEVYAPILAGAE